jgi:hypothetical protein
MYTCVCIGRNGFDRNPTDRAPDAHSQCRYTHQYNSSGFSFRDKLTNWPRTQHIYCTLAMKYTRVGVQCESRYANRTLRAPFTKL